MAELFEVLPMWLAWVVTLLAVPAGYLSAWAVAALCARLAGKPKTDPKGHEGE